MKETIQESTDELAQEYIKRKITDAYAEVEKERLGKACGCDNCIRKKVRELNEWIDWLFEGDERAENYKYSVIKGKNGKLRILAGMELKEI